jgi:hypothetical protein
LLQMKRAVHYKLHNDTYHHEFPHIIYLKMVLLYLFHAIHDMPQVIIFVSTPLQ